MTTLKQGDLIKDRNEYTHKVLGVCGEVVHVSGSNLKSHDFTATETELKEELGYTWDTPAWEPSKKDEYWYISILGNVRLWSWSDEQDDHSRRDFLGIYQTKELAEAALLEIRRKLGK